MPATSLPAPPPSPPADPGTPRSRGRTPDPGLPPGPGRAGPAVEAPAADREAAMPGEPIVRRARGSPEPADHASSLLLIGSIAAETAGPGSSMGRPPPR